MNLEELNRIANDAEEKWTAEIRKAFPKKHPGDIRYISSGKGESGTPLRFAYVRRMESVKLWSKAYRDHLGINR